MASLVLGAAGAFVGSFAGPLGTSIGWSIGSALGSFLTREKIEGPRLTDLKLQGSQYGTMIPIPYAAVRISGQVIWQTDLHEHEETSGGKGGPEVTNYTYTASFAILLCEGPIAALSRIWADSRLVHDAASYENQATLKFKLYYGTEDQMPDPTMEAEEGAGNVPAHRGYAYIVFDEIDLGEFGNRIPSFTFEVFTAVDQTVGLHEVRRATGSVEWGNYEGGDGTPWIVSWPAPTEKIVIKNMEGLPGHDYNNPDLTYSGSTNDPGPNEHNVEIWAGGISPLAVYWSAGYATIAGVVHPLFVNPTFEVNLAGFNPPIAATTVYSADGMIINTDREVAALAGIDDGLFIAGLSLSPNTEVALIFTAATYGGNITEWHRMIDGEVEASGPVTPALPFASLGYAPWDASGSGIVNTLENNGEYVWVLDADNDERVSVYRVDPDTGIFALDPDAGTLDLDDGAGGTKPSIRAIKDGFIGVIMSDQLAVVSRMPLSVAEGVSLSSVVSDLCGRAGLPSTRYDVTQLDEDYVHGYVIAQQSQVRPLIGHLQAAYFFDAVESEDRVRFVKRTNNPIVTIPDDDLAAAGWGERMPAEINYTRQQESELPRVVTVNFVNSDEDYQQGSQPAKRDTVTTEQETTVALAIAMKPLVARTIAYRTLWLAWVERDRFIITLPRKYAHYEPTDVVAAGDWTMRLTRKREIPGGAIQFDAVATAATVYVPAGVGVPGLGYVPGRPPIKQLTDFMIIDTPLVDDDDFPVGVYIAAAGQRSTQWSGAAIFQSKDGGTTYSQIGSVNIPAVMGTTASVLADFAGSNQWDDGNSLTVTLTVGSSGTLESSTTELVLGGANMLLVGNEYIQFQTATLTGTRTYALSRFLRGRRGTEWAMSGHAVGERVVLMSSATDLQLSAADIGLQYLYKAVTSGETIDAAPPIGLTFHAIRLRPYSPASVGGGSDASGNVTVNWLRRTRVGGAWTNFADVPLSENTEQYVVQVWDSDFEDCARITTVDATQTWQYTTTMQIADFGAIQRVVYVTVGQVGTYGLGTEKQGTIQGLAGGALNSPVLVPIDPYPTTWEPPVSESTVDENHMENFADLMGSDRQLAYHYAFLGPLQGIAWYQRHQYQIADRFFLGDTWALARWIQDATYNRPFLTQPEADMLFDLAIAAGS